MPLWISPALLLMAQATAPQTAEAAITNPDWLRRPTAEQIIAAYPRRAISMGIDSGTARLRCTVTATGALTACTVASESPAGSGFGAAALSLTPQFVMRPQTVNGRPTGAGTVTIPIRFSGVPSSVRRGAPSSAAGGLLVGAVLIDGPSRADVAAVAPPGVAGWASLRCELDAEGRGTRCERLAEEPEDRRLAEAARRLAGRFQVAQPATLQGNVGRYRVDVRVAFGGETPAYVRRPAWLRTPTGADVQAALEPHAQAEGDKTAGATADCEIGPRGALTACRVSGETSAEAGAAVAALAERFTVRPWNEDGVPVIGARLRLPLRYVAD